MVQSIPASALKYRLSGEKVIPFFKPTGIVQHTSRRVKNL
jgi:hypothetical protein